MIKIELNLIVKPVPCFYSLVSFFLNVLFFIKGKGES